MSFNFASIGRPVARVTGGALDKKKVYLTEETEDDEYVKSFTKIELPQASRFSHIPDPEKNRDVTYIVGPSGSGKTTYTTAYIKEILKIHKDYKVILFSTLDDDYKDIKNLQRVKIDMSLVDDPIKADELKDSIVVFDDVDCIADKMLRASIIGTMQQVLEIGRHFNIYVIMTNHLATNGADTKRILNECNTITFFPQAGTGRGLTYLLENYCGLNTKDIRKIKKFKSRWCTFYKTFPQMLLFERNIMTLDELENV